MNKYCTLFSEKSPKGFGKFFGERSAKPQKSDDKEKSSSSSSSKSEQSQSGKSEPPPGTDRKPDDDMDILKKIKAEYKSFDQLSGGGGSDGKKSDGRNNSEREKWFTFGMIGSAIAIAAVSYYGYSYQEISWKDLTR